MENQNRTRQTVQEFIPYSTQRKMKDLLRLSSEGCDEKENNEFQNEKKRCLLAYVCWFSYLVKIYHALFPNVISEDILKKQNITTMKNAHNLKKSYINFLKLA